MQGGANAGADVGAETSGKGAKAGTNAGADVGAETSGKGDKAGAKRRSTATPAKRPKGNADMTTDGKAGANADGQANTDKPGAPPKARPRPMASRAARPSSARRRSARCAATSITTSRALTRQRNEVNVSIGIALPGTIALYDLPPDVIVVEGACPIKYFVWDDDVVLVDSCSRQVVDTIVDVA